MDDQRLLYVMVSRTDTGIARIIRIFSRCRYNHVSVTLDPSFRTWVSFARHIQDTPLYGGFILESAERYLARGYDTPVRIYALRLSSSRCRQLRRLFHLAGEPDTGLIYNLFDAVAVAFGRSLPVPGAYTCLSFANAVLGRQYTSIAQLCDGLAPDLIYDGLLSNVVSDSGSREEEYFRHLGPLRGTWRSARQLAVLSGRALRPACFGDVVARRLM